MDRVLGIAVSMLLFLSAIAVEQINRASLAVHAATAPSTAGVLDACSALRWVGAWMAAPQGSSATLVNQNSTTVPAEFDDQALRVIVTPSISGSAIRIHVSNRYGASPLALDTVTVGVRSEGASVVPGSTVGASFGGSGSVVVSVGEDAVSDPVMFNVVASLALAVTFHVDGSSALDVHQVALATNYATAPGIDADESGATFVRALTASYSVTSVDVLAPGGTGVVVTLGDSITDGVGSTPDANERWPDQLTRILGGVAIVNAGISGNRVGTNESTTTKALGPPARERVVTDALEVPGVTDLLVFEGINDITGATVASDAITIVIDGYRSILGKAHSLGVNVIGATITPAGLSGDMESARLVINEWIRTSGAFDEVVDFDSAVRDPARPATVRPEFDASFAHLTDAGYATLAAAIVPSLFVGSACNHDSVMR